LDDGRREEKIMAVNPKREDLERFFEEDLEGPIVMLNLLRFALGGREKYEAYVAGFRSIAGRFGAELVYAGDGKTALIAEPGQGWDAVILVRYPDRGRFLAMVADAEYQRFTHLRTEALEEAVLQATTPWTLGGS
jgi:uncharacterized protein (DUF1330 family)